MLCSKHHLHHWDQHEGCPWCNFEENNTATLPFGDPEKLISIYAEVGKEYASKEWVNDQFHLEFEVKVIPVLKKKV